MHRKLTITLENITLVLLQVANQITYGKSRVHINQVAQASLLGQRRKYITHTGK